MEIDPDARPQNEFCELFANFPWNRPFDVPVVEKKLRKPFPEIRDTSLDVIPVMAESSVSPKSAVDPCNVGVRDAKKEVIDEWDENELDDPATS